MQTENNKLYVLEVVIQKIRKIMPIIGTEAINSNCTHPPYLSHTYDAKEYKHVIV
jgi:hypothetical protein